MGGSVSLSSISNKLFGRRQIARQQQPNNSEGIRRPLLSNNSLSHTTQGRNRQTQQGKQSNFRPNVGIFNSKLNVSTSLSAGPARATVSPVETASASTSLSASPARATVSPVETASASASTSLSAGPAAPQLSIEQIRSKMNLYCFKKSRNIVQIHQRHATTCANVLNKGFDAKGSIGELAPNTSLSAIGIQQCMQVSDFLLCCKSRNIDYITSQDYQTIDALKPKNRINNAIQLNANSNQNQKNRNNSKKTIRKSDLINLITDISIEESLKNLIIDKLNEEIKEESLNLVKYKMFLDMFPVWKITVDESTLSLLNNIGTNFTIKDQVELIQKKELRPMLIFCCSELLRTQQTLFITYFDIIKDYLKNRRKIIVLFWLNEQHFSKMTNADNFVVSLAHTKQQWKYFIKRIKNLEFDKDFMENIGREVGQANLEEFSKKLNLEEKLQTSTAFSKKAINYEEWEDIFYVSPHIYLIRDSKARLLENFSFDNRRFSSGKSKFIVGKKMWDPKEMYRELPAILSQYLLDSTIITHDSDYGVDFYEERIGPDVKMNIVFVSHHSSGENTIKYATNEASVAIFKEKQQLMNCELVILPKGGILGKKEYGREFGGVNDDEYTNLVKTAIKNLINEYTRLRIISGNEQINSIMRIIASLDSAIEQNLELSSHIQQLENSRIMLLNKLYPRQDSISENYNIKLRISLIEKMIIYSKYLNSLRVIVQNTHQPAFSLKNRIFPVGFYDSIITSTVKRKNKTKQFREIYPLFILYNSQLGIFFTPLDVIKQEVAIIPDVIMPSSPPAASQHVGGIFGFGKKERPQSVVNQGPQTGIQLSSQIFSLSSPFSEFLDMTLDEYINFLETSNKILIQINGMYNPQQSVTNVPAGVASAAVEHPEGNGNTYFYDYKKLSEIINGIISKIVQYNSLKKKIYNESKKKLKNNIQKSNLNIDLKSFHQNTIPIYKEQTLLDYLREKFDTKTLVHNLGRCLFDFCATTEPARNKLRQIVREKLKLEVGEKDYKKIFKLEAERQLQKFIDDYEKEHGVLQENSTQKVIPISKGLFPTKESKQQILQDIKLIKKSSRSDEPAEDLYKKMDMYKKYNIIDNLIYLRIKLLIREFNSKNKNTTNKAIKQRLINEYREKIFNILRPYQKKLLDSIINKNIRHKNNEKSEKIQNKNKGTVNITNTPVPLKKSKYIVIKNKNSIPQNYIKYQNIPTDQRR